MNNRKLLIVFIGVLVLFFAAKLLRRDHTSSFDPVLLSLDTAKVDKIRFIESGAGNKQFDLVRSGSTWKAIQNTNEVMAPASSINSILQVLSRLNAKRIVTKDPDKYAEYEIGDDQVSAIQVWVENKQVADLLIGGFRFDQATKSASAFVRKRNGEAVYLIDGFMMMGLKQSFDQYRDKTLVKAIEEDISKLEWLHASGKKEVILKEDGIWHYAGMEAVDTTTFNSYLSSLVNARGAEFSDLTSTQGLTLIESLTLIGNNMIEPTVISAFNNNDAQKPFLIHSSINPSSVFLSDSMGIYKMIFTDLRKFWPDGQ